ncbi:MAG: hypothetical protein NTW86_30905 [Candidatus Sumerlaeota bacterium]|nr:hypothetical protein [Candidatus Sumerlaeota bacterium]
MQTVDASRLTALIRRAKAMGFSDQQLAFLATKAAGGAKTVAESHVRRLRKQLGLSPVFKCVDTCAGEFEAFTPYYYSTYDAAPYPWANESVRSPHKKIVILGGGPNRIGQGIEFDYCCVHAVMALRDLGFETIMVNSNPETVSTDYDTADKLYFEPVTAEDVLAILDLEQPDGVIVQFGEKLERLFAEAIRVSPGHPVLIDQFLDGAIEIDVDALGDGERIVIAAVMEHVEEAGIHSGDSACVIPSHSLKPETLETIRGYTHTLGKALSVMGLMNIQYAVQNGKVFVLEVNPRASRTVPFVSKSIGRPIAKLAAQIMVGKTLKELKFTREPKIPYYCVKEAVLPFAKFPECRVVLGPEMRSTGEVMGIDFDLGQAFAKSQAGAGSALPLEGGVFISVNDHDKPAFLPVAEKLAEMGFHLYATQGTSRFLRDHGISSLMIFKVNEGRPNVVDFMINRSIQMVINTFVGEKSKYDEDAIRSNAIQRGIPLFTTVAAAKAVVDGIAAMKRGSPTILPIQDYHKLVPREE